MAANAVDHSIAASETTSIRGSGLQGMAGSPLHWPDRTGFSAILGSARGEAKQFRGFRWGSMPSYFNAAFWVRLGRSVRLSGPGQGREIEVQPA